MAWEGVRAEEEVGGVPQGEGDGGEHPEKGCGVGGVGVRHGWRGWGLGGSGVDGLERRDGRNGRGGAMEIGNGA